MCTDTNFINLTSFTIKYGDQYKTGLISSLGQCLPKLEYNGTAFDGWYTDPTGGTKVTDTTVYSLNTNQTLYAHW